MTDQAPPVVIVDTREPKWMADQVAAYGLTVVTDALPAGDFCFFPHGLRVVIERKTTSDLMNSLKPPSGERGGSSRMVAQCHKMIEFADAAILLVEGQYRPTASGMVEIEQKDGWRETGWGWDSFQSILLDITWMGIMKHQCPINQSPREVARVVASLCKDEHRWIRQRERPNVMTIDRQYRNPVWALAAFDKVGVDWADSLLKTCGTFEEVVISSVDRLSEIKRGGKKFGKKRAEVLVAQWKKEWK